MPTLVQHLPHDVARQCLRCTDACRRSSTAYEPHESLRDQAHAVLKYEYGQMHSLTLQATSRTKSASAQTQMIMASGLSGLSLVHARTRTSTVERSQTHTLPKVLFIVWHCMVATTAEQAWRTRVYPAAQSQSTGHKQYFQRGKLG